MSELRLAEILVGLSAVTDLGMGQPQGAAAKACLLATSLARAVNLPDQEVHDVYYTSLLQHIGCTAYSHESAAFFADEQSVKRATQVTNFNDMRDIFFGYIPSITRNAPAGARARTFRSALLKSGSITDGYTISNCEVGSSMARRLSLFPGVEQGLLHIFEWWNGKGRPQHLKGETIATAARVAHVAGYGALFDRLGGPDAAIAAVRKRSGGYLDPGLAENFCEQAPKLLAELSSVDVHEGLRHAEPKPHLTIPEHRLDEVLKAFGDVVDLKAPFFHGHSSAVSSLAESAAERLGIPQPDVVRLRRAALVHDLGRAGIANGIWERPGPLHADDWSQVRLHPYHSEQVLQRAEPLADLGPIAGAHHERLDGSGYFRQTTASSLPMIARVLAAADVYTAMIQPRPHRPALARDKAAAELRSEARKGTLDVDAVDAVLNVAGHPAARVRREWPAGLSDRQVEVLRLITDGLSNRQIAEKLHVTVRTAEHHAQDVYLKIGVSSRAAAALFAMEHHLIGPKDW